MAEGMTRFGEIRRLLLFVAAGLLIVAIFLPVWQITLDAPQYPPPEGPLEVELYMYPGLDGDVDEVDRLNRYVGFYYPDPVWVEPDFPIHETSIEAPEWVLAPLLFVILAGLTVFVAVAPTSRKFRLGVVSLFVGTVGVFVASLIFIQYRLYQAGHSLDPNAPMDIAGFTPPVLGSYEVANISGFAWVGPGGYVTILAVMLMFIAVLLRKNDAAFPDLFTGSARQAANTEAVFSVAALAMVAAVVGAPMGSSFDPDPRQGPDIDVEVPEPPDVAPERTATVDDREFSTASAALQAARPGQTVVLEGRFDERLIVDTPDVVLRGGPAGAVVDANEQGRIVTVEADDVVVEDLWLRHSGRDLGQEDAGVFVDADGVELRSLHLTDIAFGIWVDGVDDVTIADNFIQGRPDLLPVVRRGNGIQLWNADGAVVADNHIREVRDGIYFSWAESVDARDNRFSDNRYGVHYMYSSDNRLASNAAVDNDVGYALMVSNNLEIVDNLAARNSGPSGHGILVKDIDDSTLRNNTVVDNDNGLYVYNAQDNRLENNLVLENRIGLQYTAGSSGQTVVSNSFIHNDTTVKTPTRRMLTFSEDGRGNYWSGARTVDFNGDGISEIRYRPAGVVEHLVSESPPAAVFAGSPAFDAIRLAESSFPVVEAPGVLDEHPLVEPPHHDWQRHATDR